MDEQQSVAENRHLVTSDQVFEVLGGLQGVIDLTGDKYKTVHFWKQAGSFPPNLHVMMTAALAVKGYTAAPELWRMRFQD